MNKPDKNWLEWTVFGISLVLVLGTLGYLAYDSATGSESPPDIVVQLGTPRNGSASFQVPVTAFNNGNTTAEDVMIEITLTNASTSEQAQLHFAYMPRESSRDGWVTFHTDPRAATLSARVLGYEEP